MKIQESLNITNMHMKCANTSEKTLMYQWRREYIPYISMNYLFTKSLLLHSSWWKNSLTINCFHELLVFLNRWNNLRKISLGVSIIYRSKLLRSGLIVQTCWCLWNVVSTTRLSRVRLNEVVLLSVAPSYAYVSSYIWVA